MSRETSVQPARQRPTRAETRARLIDVAAELFAERGVLGTSVEDVVAAAGYTRGAFYSNFKDRDELANAVTEQVVEDAIAANAQLLAQHGSAGLVDALRRHQGPSPLLDIELLLHALRSPTGRARYVELRRRLREGLAPVVETTLRDFGVEQPIDALGVTTLLLAIEDGILLHSHLDPEAVPPGSYLQVLGDLIEAARTSQQPLRGIVAAPPRKPEAKRSRTTRRATS